MRLLVESDPLRVRIALLDGDRLVELQIEGPSPSTVGDIYLGRVQRIAPAIDAAFVDLGFSRKAFLHANDFALAPDEALETHQPVVVQVFRDAVPGKGPRVRRGASLPGRYLVLLTTGSGVAVSSRIDDTAERERLIEGLESFDDGSVGWIVRTAAVGVDAAELAVEAESLLAAWRAIKRSAATAKPPKLLHSELDTVERWSRDRVGGDLSEIWVDSSELEARMSHALDRLAPELAGRLKVHQGPPTLFERFGVESQLARLWSRHVSLPAGGSLVIESTEALVTIDVNSGRDLAAANLEETALATNLEAAREAARQLRLRDLSGIIVIDFIDMTSAENWDDVRQVLDHELALDRATTMTEGPTAFGLVAITRKRARNDLVRQLSVECPGCRGTGRLRSPVEVVAEARRALLARAAASPEANWRLLLHPAVMVEARGPAAPLLEDLELQLAERIEIEAVESVDRTHFEIEEVSS